MESVDRLISLISSGNQHESKMLLERFFSEEFSSLSSKDHVVKLRDFQLYSRLPMLISNQLYDTFIISTSGLLTKECYVDHFMKIYTGTVESRIEFLYNFLCNNSYDQKSFLKNDIHIMFRILFININNNNTINSSNSLDSNKNGLKTIDHLIDLFFTKTADKNKCQSLNEFRHIILNEDSSFFFFFYYAMHFNRTYNKEILLYIKEGIIANILKPNRSNSQFQNHKNEPVRKENRAFTDMRNDNVASKTLQIAYSILGSNGVFLKRPSHLLIDLYAQLLKHTSPLEEDDDYTLFIQPEDDTNDFEDLNLFETDLISTKSNLDDEMSPKKINNHLIFDLKESLFPYPHNRSIFPRPSNAQTINESSYLPKKRTLYKSTNGQKSHFFNSNSNLQFSSTSLKSNQINENEDEIRIMRNDVYQVYKIGLIHNQIFLYKWNKRNGVYKYKYMIPLIQLYISKNEPSTKDGYYPIKLTSLLYQGQRQDIIFFFLSEDSKAHFIEFYNLFNIDHTLNYTISEKIGQGHYSTVYKGKEIKTGKDIAIKIIKRQEKKEYEQMLQWEIDVSFLLKAINHPNIIQCYEIYETIDYVYVILEYVPMGSLTTYLSQSKSCLSFSTIDLIIQQMLHALKHLDYFGVMHRDIKTDNILISASSSNTNDLNVTLNDFGLAKICLPSMKQKDSCGTLVFSAPEIISKCDYDSRVDIWSLGVLCYYLQFTVLPFKIHLNHDTEDIVSAILHKDLIIPRDYREGTLSQADVDLQEKINKFIYICLRKDYNNRPMISDIPY